MKWWALCLVILLLACAGPRVRRRGKPPPGSRYPPVTEQEIGPERQASNSLIDEGRGFLEAGLYDRAGSSFQEAVKVDRGNGAGYYWLAVVKFRTGEYGAVWDLIDRAESLLGTDAEWEERIETLKQELEVTHPD